MKDITILNEGNKDFLNPLDEKEMNFIKGGVNSDMESSVTCKKGYSSSECKCGYSGPAFPTTSEITAEEL